MISILQIKLIMENNGGKLKDNQKICHIHSHK
jgi:hypothetical protein